MLAVARDSIRVLNRSAKLLSCATVSSGNSRVSFFMLLRYSKPVRDGKCASPSRANQRSQAQPP